jgi:hypothetical protein
VTLCGCAAQEFAARKAAYDAAAKQCHDTRVRTGGSWVSYARCVNAASEQYSPPSDTAAPLIRATRLSLAVKVDRGEISPEDAGAELARVAFQAHQEQQRTGAATAVGLGVEMQGAAAMMGR